MTQCWVSLSVSAFRNASFSDPIDGLISRFLAAVFPLLRPRPPMAASSFDQPQRMPGERPPVGASFEPGRA